MKGSHSNNLFHNSYLPHRQLLGWGVYESTSGAMLVGNIFPDGVTAEARVAATIALHSAEAIRGAVTRALQAKGRWAME